MFGLTSFYIVITKGGEFEHDFPCKGNPSIMYKALDVFGLAYLLKVSIFCIYEKMKFKKLCINK